MIRLHHADAGEVTTKARNRASRVRRRAAVALAAVCLGVLLAACRSGPGGTPPESGTDAGTPVPAQPTNQPGTSVPPATPGVADGAAPTLSVADVSAAESDGTLRFTVSLNVAVAVPVTVSYATESGTAAAGTDYQSANGTLTFPADSNQAQQIEVSISDDRIAEGNETFLLRLSEPSDAALAADTAIATIVDNDGHSMRAEPAALNVTEGGTATYTLVLGSQPTDTVTVSVTPGSPELTVQPDRLSFTPAGWTTAQTVTVTAGDDEDAVADAPAPLTHSAAGGGYGGTRTEVSVTIVEDDVATLAVAAARASEQAGSIGFAVTLSLAADQEVTVHWATQAVGNTATEGQDYSGGSGTLSFPAGSTAAQTITVVVHNDELDEPDEQFTVTLSNPVHAVLAGGGATLSATGTIADDDALPVLSIEDSSLAEGDGDGSMRFTVRLEPASARTVTVDYATSDGTATASVDYTPVTGTLTFGAGSTTRTIAVPIADDQTGEDTETFTVTLSSPSSAELDIALATGTIADDDDTPPLELASLQVTGGASEMYPAFAADVYHYALTCDDSVLQVTATAKRSAAQLTVPHYYDQHTVTSVGSIRVEIDVHHNDDIVIHVSDTDERATYIVHCLPDDFPEFRVLTKTDQVSAGLLFVTPRWRSLGSNVGYLAIIDNNGVPRYHRSGKERVFQHHSNGPVVDGKRVWYSFVSGIDRYNQASLLDDDFKEIRTVTVVDPVTNVDSHDFRIVTDDTSGDATFLFISRFDNIRDYSEYKDKDGNPYSSMEEVEDSVIQEVSKDGRELFRWNSWDHLKLDPDCRRGNFIGDYAHLNAVHVTDGDIVASFPGCNQVARIDRSSNTGALVWRIGGTAPTRSTGTEYLEIVSDPLREFCGQHNTTLTGSGNLLMFDNGTSCQGPRKGMKRISRVVEYDISSGTQAVLSREYRHPHEYFTGTAGGVVELDNGNWLIAWGNSPGTALDEAVSISEVDPDTGTAHLEMLILVSGKPLHTYRVYRYDEDNINIPVDRIAGDIDTF